MFVRVFHSLPLEEQDILYIMGLLMGFFSFFLYPFFSASRDQL